MRLAVAATAPLGADVLERLAAKHDVAYLLTRPDRPQGRGRKLAPPPAKEAAERLGIDVRQPERLDGFDPEVGTVVVAAYGVLIPEDVLDRALWLNVHPSLLPRWRGAAPIERALMAGDERDGRLDHRARAGARRRADRGAAGVPARSPRTTSARSRRGRASWRPSCSRRRCPSRRCGRRLPKA